MAEVGTIMTKREKEIFQTVKELGISCPREISERVGISPDCAEQLCRDMVWLHIFIKKGPCYEIAQNYSLRI